MTEPPDELAGLLGPLPVSHPNPDHRERTLAATVRVRRRGRLVRRASAAAGAVGLFLAGGVVGWGGKPAPPVPEVALTEPSPPPPLVVPQAAESQPLTAERLELLAELADDTAEAARLYREAGDRFLTDRDYENAARCYRRHLSVADAESQRVSASDSWMLHTMKSPVR